jgi:DNA-binding MarR family transcriptional regulator
MHLQILYMHGNMNGKTPRHTKLRDDAVDLVEHCAGWNSRIAARRITAFFEREIASTGLSVSQLGLMAAVAATSDDTLGALALKTGLDQSTLSRNLRTLEGEGFVEIATVESDLRRRVVWLTETGARRLAAAMPVWRAAQAKLSETLSVDAVRQIARDTERLARD